LTTIGREVGRFAVAAIVEGPEAAEIASVGAAAVTAAPLDVTPNLVTDASLLAAMLSAAEKDSSVGARWTPLLLPPLFVCLGTTLPAAVVVVICV